MTGIEKILVVRVGRGGDLIMITPALNSLLTAFPGAEFHLMTSREGNRVMKGYHPRLTHTWIYHRRFLHTLWLQWKLLRELAKEHYSRIYVFEAKPHYRRWLKSAAPALYDLAAPIPQAHYCERCLEVVEQSITSAPPRGWITLPVSESGLAKAQALLKDHGLAPDMILVGLHPTYSGSSLPLFRDRQGARHRNWPQDSFAQLAGLLHERARKAGLPLGIVIDALPEERAIVEPIVRKSGNAITLLTAPPDFERYRGLLHRLNVLVTSNTGPMHIAAAVGTSVVALFSGWSVEDCGPFVPPDRFEVLRAEDTHHPEMGLAAIAPDKVVEAVFRLLPAST